MCLAKAYRLSNGEQELVCEDLAVVQVEEGRVRISTLFGEQTVIEGRIKEIDFEAGSLIVESAA